MLVECPCFKILKVISTVRLLEMTRPETLYAWLRLSSTFLSWRAWFSYSFSFLLFISWKWMRHFGFSQSHCRPHQGGSGRALFATVPTTRPHIYHMPHLSWRLSLHSPLSSICSFFSIWTYRSSGNNLGILGPNCLYAEDTMNFHRILCFFLEHKYTALKRLSQQWRTE